MIWRGDDTYELERSEPSFRSCWVCNPAHDYLKDVNTLFACFGCGKQWIFGRFLDEMTEKERDEFFASKGLKPGDSTTKIEAGYKGAMVLRVEIIHPKEEK